MVYFSTDTTPLSCHIVDLNRNNGFTLNQPASNFVSKSYGHHRVRLAMYQNLFCSCSHQDIACAGCGNVVGYYTQMPYITCLCRHLNVYQQLKNHDWIFYQEDTVSTPRTTPRTTPKNEPLKWKRLISLNRSGFIHSGNRIGSFEHQGLESSDSQQTDTTEIRNTESNQTQLSQEYSYSGYNEERNGVRTDSFFDSGIQEQGADSNSGLERVNSPNIYVQNILPIYQSIQTRVERIGSGEFVPPINTHSIPRNFETIENEISTQESPESYINTMNYTIGTGSSDQFSSVSSNESISEPNVNLTRDTFTGAISVPSNYRQEIPTSNSSDSQSYQESSPLQNSPNVPQNIRNGSGSNVLGTLVQLNTENQIQTNQISLNIISNPPTIRRLHSNADSGYMSFNHDFSDVEEETSAGTNNVSRVVSAASGNLGLSSNIQTFGSVSNELDGNAISSEYYIHLGSEFDPYYAESEEETSLSDDSEFI
ncbi:hypothetical protein BB559_000881 [Furculomyces boomerangus]|uniref:Yippee domain-containing protein n=1 Tax=Furculomyces boomerangus TaxID=61424 RepID=A0A2T9Z3U0_9FUNG|nr:hypothetical protein BB559_000881 [Furculomyces boomerangus]